MMAPEARQAETVRKMLRDVTDVRVVLVSCRPVHNMRTLEFLDTRKQHRIARETLDIYAPIALRLGMSVVRVSSRTWRSLSEPEPSSPGQKKSAKGPLHKKISRGSPGHHPEQAVEAGHSR